VSRADRFLDPRPFGRSPPALMVRLALSLRRGLQRLTDGIFPAHLVILERSLGVSETMTLGMAARLGVSDLLEQRGPLTADEIAQALDLHPDRTHRLLRALASRGVYTLGRDGRFANNRLSRALRADTPWRTHSWASYMSARSMVNAWGELERAARDGSSPFETTHGMSVWDWFDAHPEERETFAHAMMGITFMDAPVVAKTYPFDEVKVVCDIGGGRGTLLSELIIRHPHLRGVLCDAPGVLESARSLLLARGVADRIELAATNFFDAVPSGADAYLMKNVLHDWNDERCRTILANVRRAIGAGGRLVVVEALCERNDAGVLAPLADLQMMIVCDGGRERSRDEYAALFESAGFRLTRVFPHPTLSVIEARPI
jgi:hypothetical protein